MYELIISEAGCKRIFEGELVPVLTRGGEVNHYRVKGFRLEDDSTGNTIIEPTRTSSDARGVYFAQSVVKGASRKRTYNAFFPRGWTRERTLRAIAEAHENRLPRQWMEQGNFFEGHTSEGMRIIMELDAAGLVIDAFPLRAKVNQKKEALHRIKQGTQTRSRYVCGECQSVKVLVCPNGHGQKRAARGWFGRRWRKMLWRLDI